jgi:hypothetical protein
MVFFQLEWNLECQFTIDFWLHTRTHTFYITSEIFLYVVGLRMLIRTQSNITPVTVLRNLPAFVMLSAEHTLSCWLRFLFCGRDPLKKVLFCTALYCSLQLVNLALHTARNTSPVTQQSSLVWISNGQLPNQNFCYRWGKWELWSWISFVNNFMYH